MNNYMKRNGGLSGIVSPKSTVNAFLFLISAGVLFYVFWLNQKLPLSVLHDEYLYAKASIDIGVGSKSTVPSTLYYFLTRGLMTLVDDPLIAARLLNVLSWASLIILAFLLTRDYKLLTRLKIMSLVIFPFQFITLTYLMPDYFFYSMYMLAVLSMSRQRFILGAVFLIAAALVKVHGLLSYFLYVSSIVLHYKASGMSGKEILRKTMVLCALYLVYVACNALVYGEVKFVYSGTFYGETIPDFLKQGYYKTGVGHGLLAFLGTSLLYIFILIIYVGLHRLLGIFKSQWQDAHLAAVRFALLNLLGYVLVQSVFTGIADATAHQENTFIYLRYSMFALSGALLALIDLESDDVSTKSLWRTSIEIAVLVGIAYVLLKLSAHWIFYPNDELFIFTARDLYLVVVVSFLIFVSCKLLGLGQFGRLAFFLTWVPVMLGNLYSYRLNWGDFRPKDAEAIGVVSAVTCRSMSFSDVEYSEKYRVMYGYDVGRWQGRAMSDSPKDCLIREKLPGSTDLEGSISRGKYEIVDLH